MNEDIIETTAVALADSSLPVTRKDLDKLAEKRTLLREFVKAQLREGIKGDYAVVPGTGSSKSLLQPGAEKLCQLFGLRSEIELVFKEIDIKNNFAMFSYKCSIFHISSGQKISECEAFCNSQEKKYAEKTEWIEQDNGPKVKSRVPQQVPDILNTLSKMCQKRAFVGAVIRATGASDFFTQDIDDDGDATQLGIKPEMKGAINFYVEGKKEDTMAAKDTLKSMGARWTDNRWTFTNASENTLNKVESISGLKAVKI